MNADDLKNEDIGRWLWFRSEVFEAAMARRGATFQWYTRDTGGIFPIPGYSIHFGINESRLLTVYAYDIARLPEWQRRFWLGFNVTPEGKVSRELLDSQVRAEPAKTKAPEAFFAAAMENLDTAAEARWGERIFRGHGEVEQLSKTVNRFRAHDQSGLYSLAKDISRLVIDRINVDLLHKVVSPNGGDKLASLKSLERVLASLCGDADQARSALTSLVGVYELRLADAHLPSSKIGDAMRLVPVDEESHPMDQGFQLIEATVLALQNIRMMIERPAASNT